MEKMIKEQINLLKQGIILEMKKNLEEMIVQVKPPANTIMSQMPNYYYPMTTMKNPTTMQQQYQVR